MTCERSAGRCMNQEAWRTSTPTRSTETAPRTTVRSAPAPTRLARSSTVWTPTEANSATGRMLAGVQGDDQEEIAARRGHQEQTSVSPALAEDEGHDPERGDGDRGRSHTGAHREIQCRQTGSQVRLRADAIGHDLGLLGIGRELPPEERQRIVKDNPSCSPATTRWPAPEARRSQPPWRQVWTTICYGATPPRRQRWPQSGTVPSPHSATVRPGLRECHRRSPPRRDLRSGGGSPDRTIPPGSSPSPR